LGWTDQDWEITTHSYELFSPGGEELGGINLRGFFRPIEEGGESERFQVRLRRPFVPEEEVGEGFVLRVRVGFADGLSRTEEVVVRLSCCDRL
jgi:hypothetical protein